MKKNSFIFLFACVAFVLFASQNIVAQDKKKGKETVKFLVEDMECKNCQAKVEKNIAFETGVTDLKCNLKDRTVEVTYKADKTNPEKIAQGFAKIGYAVEIVKEKKVENPDKKE